jgi:hypothetical protein
VPCRAAELDVALELGDVRAPPPGPALAWEEKAEEDEDDGPPGGWRDDDGVVDW